MLHADADYCFLLLGAGGYTLSPSQADRDGRAGLKTFLEELMPPSQRYERITAHFTG